MKLNLKPDVRLTDLSPQMVIAVLVFMGHVEDLVRVLTITSANDSGHKTYSKHYSGNALDFRTKDIYMTLSDSQRLHALQTLRNTLQNSLPGFDVVLESVNLPNEHMHIEWDPKWTPATQSHQV